MIPPIVFTYDEINRIFYERIRRAVVAANLLPDTTLYTTNTEWQAARSALLASMGANGRLADVIGVGSFDDRGLKESSRIIVNRVGEKKGSIGGFPATYYQPKENGKFDKFYMPDKTTDLEYEVRVITDLTRYDSALSSIVHNSLKQRRYLPSVNPQGQYTEKAVLVVSNGMVDLSDKNFMERVFRYTVHDIFIEEPTLIQADIPAMTTVNIGFRLLPDTQANNLGTINIDPT